VLRHHRAFVRSQDTGTCSRLTGVVGERLRYRQIIFQATFPSYEEWVIQNGPERQGRAVPARRSEPLRAPGRSETIEEEGKERRRLNSISEAQQVKRMRWQP